MRFYASFVSFQDNNNSCIYCTDIRDCYAAVKETLYRQDLTKVVFILHSQGGIEGGMIIDWLLQEVPQDLLAKLEVYTFGNAANHFNNPHSHLVSQHAALASPMTISTTRTTTQVHYHDPVEGPPTSSEKGFGNGKSITTKSSRQSSSSGKTIRYIEHYAHTSDFVARWGVLHFVTNFTTGPGAELTYPRYMGECHFSYVLCLVDFSCETLCIPDFSSKT
jgi:hypothetical protein